MIGGTEKTSVALALAGACALAGCSGPASGPGSATASAAGQITPMGAEEVFSLYARPHREDGVVIQGDHAGAHWTKWADPNGTLKLTAAHGMFTDTGRFVLKGNEVCFTWQSIDDGKTNCMHVARIGADEYANLTPAGAEMSTFRVLQDTRVSESTQ
jgi:hypothetical protein